MTLQLAANAEMLFRDLPFAERVRRIHDLGYLVEIWDWTTKDIDELVATGATFSSMTGYIEGDLITEAGSQIFLETAELSLQVAQKLDCPRLNVHGTGLDNQGLPVRPKESVTDADWAAAIKTLSELAQLGEKAERVFTIENLNLRVDHPGTPFATSEEALRLVKAVDSPALQLNLDLYHAQIDEGNLIARTREALPFIGEIQVADVPGRMEPGTGEINFRNIADALTSMGYDGVVALEAWASGDSVRALEKFHKAFA